VNSENRVVIEVFGEGKTDVQDEARSPTPEPPTKGVVPVLVHTLCGRPVAMLVKRYGRLFMQQRGSLKQKARSAKGQARISGSAGAVFVVDSDGDLKGRKRDLNDGRRMEPGDFPMAIGVGHPCIETWLLADPAAIRRGLELPKAPQTPDEPESLATPSQDKRKNPKAALARAAGQQKQDLSAREKERIAVAMNDLPRLRERCPQGFAPFADEVEFHIGPLF